MHISVQVTPEAARALHAKAGARSPLPSDLAALSKLIQPVHQGVADEALKAFFFAEAPDASAAARLIETLTRSPHVIAAYVKPADELP